MAEYIPFSLLGENQSIWWDSMSMVVVLIMVNDFLGLLLGMVGTKLASELNR